MSKSSLPVLWPMWMIVFLIFNAIVYVFVIRLSFVDLTWETALAVTSMDRIVSLLAVLLFALDMYFLVGMIRLLQRRLRESKVLD